VILLLELEELKAVNALGACDQRPGVDCTGAGEILGQERLGMVFHSPFHHFADMKIPGVRAREAARPARQPLRATEPDGRPLYVVLTERTPST
jgi:hypothetical protein